MTPDVPPAYPGLWRRTAIRRSNGSSDLTTAVWWLQSARFHLDLRIPADRPRLADAAVFAALAPAQQALFLRQSGFAGSTVVEGERCEWRPEIAFPAISPELDAGWMRFDTPDRLHEAGLDGSYDEDWVRTETGPMLGLRLVSEQSDEIAYLLVGATLAAWGRGKPDGRFPADWAVFSVLQRVDGNWRIAASNQPWLEGANMDAVPSLEQAAAWTPGQRVAPDGRWRVTDIA